MSSTPTPTPISAASGIETFIDAQQLLHVLMARCATGLIVVNAQGLIEFVNPLAQSLCASTPDQLVGQHCATLLAPDLPPTVHNSLQKALSSGCSWGLETRIQRLDGTHFWCDFQLVLVESTPTDSTRWCVMLRDISHLSNAGDTVQPALGSAGAVDAHAHAVAELRNAIVNNELRLFYQPQLSLHSGQVIGLEALVRWQHPTRGLLAPVHFIALAEENGLIITLGEWVMRTAVQQIRVWQDEGLTPVRVAVNLSAPHFRQKDLPDAIAKLLSDYGVPASLFELELTESVMMHDAQAAILIVDRLKTLGLRVSLDDFGTGYSSLAYLSRFAIDVIKIDQSFVADITTNPVNAAIATATIAMAHKLGKTVIAEGVETQGQMVYLRRHECDEMQGYLFSQAVDASTIGDILRSGVGINLNLDQGETQMTLLLVDDEPNILNALKRLLRREGYHILCAESAAQGLDLLATHQVHVIISDQRMPVMMGTEFLSRVKDLYPDTVRLVLSGYSELESLTDAINKGAIYRYISKPWNDDKFKQEVTQAFRYYRERNPESALNDRSIGTGSLECQIGL